LAGENYNYNPESYNLADYMDMSNVYCATFKEELSGYMVGYAAVKLGYTKLGFIGGMAVRSVQHFGYGYIQGADDAAGELGVDVTIKYAYGNQFYGDADITATMDTWYADGTEAVFACGGNLFTSVAEAAQKVGGKIIGVDTDQSPVIDGLYGAGMTITSAMKGIYPIIVDTLTDIIINDNWSAYAGQIDSLGFADSPNPEAHYVQIPMDSTQWAEGFTQADYRKLLENMTSGHVTVSEDISQAPKTLHIHVEYLGNIKG
jgi:basic membrane protein A